MGEVFDGVKNLVVGFYQGYHVVINIVAIVLGAVLLNALLRHLLMRTVTQVVRGVKRSHDVESTQELTMGPQVSARAIQRTRTLGTVGRHVILWSVCVVALILVLGQLKVNVAALLASAGIVGAGLAFGAQNIVKDILNGIFMVFEDQLGVGDYVTIGEISGTVEDVGIRVTRVRASDGTLWFVRNGEVLALGNLSQGWGRALINVTVDANQDLEHVCDVALEAARALIVSERYSRKVVGEPDVLGFESVFGDRATFGLAVRTRAEAQWEIQRALRAEIQRCFVDNDIRLASELPPNVRGAL